MCQQAGFHVLEGQTEALHKKLRICLKIVFKMRNSWKIDLEEQVL